MSGPVDPALGHFVLARQTTDEGRAKVRTLIEALKGSDMGVAAVADESLRYLAFQYRDDEDYREEWKP